MLFTNTPRSRRNKAQSRLASACVQTVETLESRRLLTVTGLDITAITSSADTDGGLGGAEHVTVVPGSTVTATFTYSSTEGNTTTAKFNLDTAPASVTTTPQGTVVPSGPSQTASLSLVIPLGTTPGTYAAHVQVKNGQGSGATENDSDAAAVTVVFTVAPLAATLTISAADVSYSGSAYAESNITNSVTPSGALGVITYKFFSDAAGNNEIAAPTDAGTYYVRGHFASNDLTKWLNADSDIAEFEIAKADATITVVGYSGTYDGQAHGASGTVTGVLGESLSGLDLGDSFTNCPGGTAYWVFTDVTGNYNDASGTATIEIAKADATVAIVNYAGTYDGYAHTASVTITGVGGTILAANSISRTNAGSDSVAASISGNQNYNDASGTATIDIAKADATITVVGYSGTYDGQAHGASGTVTGVLGESLSGLELGDTFTDCPGGTANWVFTDVTGNYNNAAGSVEITIDKATLTGITRTQDALNIAKQGTLTIDISSIAGLQAADTLVDVFSTAIFKLTIGGNDYEFQPSVSIDTLTNTVRVSYTMKGGAEAADMLRAELMALDIADGGASTSASKTPYSTMQLSAECGNYSFSDDFMTRLFCSAK